MDRVNVSVLVRDRVTARVSVNVKFMVRFRVRVVFLRYVYN